MNRRAKIGGVALVLTVLLALGFGARQALAGPQTNFCYPPGACPPDGNCQPVCDQFLPGSEGVCRLGCCWCYL